MDPDYVCMVCAFTIEKKTGERVGITNTTNHFFSHMPNNKCENKKKRIEKNHSSGIAYLSTKTQSNYTNTLWYTQ